MDHLQAWNGGIGEVGADRLIDALEDRIPRANHHGGLRNGGAEQQRTQAK